MSKCPCGQPHAMTPEVRRAAKDALVLPPLDRRPFPPFTTGGK